MDPTNGQQTGECVNPMTDLPDLLVRRRKIANVLRGEPWVYENAVISEGFGPGLYRVVTDSGQPIGVADVNPKAMVVARILTRRDDFQGIETYLNQSVMGALQRRLRLGYSFQGGAARLINSEGDGLPGLVVDVYGRTLVVDFITRGMRDRQTLILAALRQHFNDSTIVCRMGSDAAKREGCEPLQAPSTEVTFAEHGIRYTLDVGAGQKTGFYLDQRDNRLLIARCAGGRKVLDLFSYQGAFSLSAVSGGAISALAVDSSEPALALARSHAQANKFGLSTLQGDVFDVLEPLAQEGPFDLIICDPPKLAPSKKDRNKGISAYRYLTDRCLRLLPEGGLLFLASCSQTINRADLLEIVSQVATKRGERMDVLALGSQPADHPWPAAFGTGHYLSAVLFEKRAG